LATSFQEADCFMGPLLLESWQKKVVSVFVHFVPLQEVYVILRSFSDFMIPDFRFRIIFILNSHTSRHLVPYTPRKKQLVFIQYFSLGFQCLYQYFTFCLYWATELVSLTAINFLVVNSCVSCFWFCTYFYCLCYALQKSSCSGSIYAYINPIIGFTWMPQSLEKRAAAIAIGEVALPYLYTWLIIRCEKHALRSKRINYQLMC
jgi:hypothetical protein